MTEVLKQKRQRAFAHCRPLKRERYRLTAALLAALLAGLVLTTLLLLIGFLLAALLLLARLILSTLLLAGLILSALLRIALIILFVCHRDVLRCEPPPDRDNPRDGRGFLDFVALFVSNTLIPQENRAICCILAAQVACPAG
jgi:hypothetical protein